MIYIVVYILHPILLWAVLYIVEYIDTTPTLIYYKLRIWCGCAISWAVLYIVVYKLHLPYYKIESKVRVA